MDKKSGRDCGSLADLIFGAARRGQTEGNPSRLGVEKVKAERVAVRLRHADVGEWAAMCIAASHWIASETTMENMFLHLD